MAYNYLEDHALRTIWCAPFQDRQSITQMAKISPFNGVFNYIKVGWNTITLPQSKTRFHVYQIGQLYPALMGLLPTDQTWTLFSDACNQENLIVDLYNTNGVQLPRTQSWYMVTRDKNLIVAVKDQPTIPVTLNTQALFLRVYTNAYYLSIRNQLGDGSGTPYPKVNVVGQTVFSSSDILSLQNQFIAAQALTGHAYAFVNGMAVSNIDPFSVNIGDVVEFVYDPSIYKVVDFTVNDLRWFDSLLDTKRKYLLHYPGNINTIDYQDDIDMFLLQPAANNRFTGMYFHKNAGDTMRMVTHKDYAVPTAYVSALASQNGYQDPTPMTLRLHIRYGGWERPVQFENNRIFELYKMQDSDILNAMLGIDSVVTNFRADTLENAAYTQIMREPLPILSETEVEDALGYNAISKLLGDTPSITQLISGQAIAQVPYGLRTNATAYEYDVNGELLSYRQVPGTDAYTCSFNTATKVEFIAGVGFDRLDEDYGSQSTTLLTSVDYRMYTCPIVNGSPTNVWTDVTGGPQYVVINNVLTWLTDPTQVYTLVRGNRYHLAYEVDTTTVAGNLQFTFTHRALRNSVISEWVMQIPMGELDIFLNGKTLVPGLDYIVKFPQVIITNKSYLNGDPDLIEQKIFVRWTGFCNSDLTWGDPELDTGFIQYGMLSENNKFDIRDDKVLRITIDGQMYTRDQLKFAETDSSVAVPGSNEGVPYMIRDIVVPTRGLTTQPTYTLRAASIVIDEAVSNYLTEKLPQATHDMPPVISQMYPVVSTFTNKLIYDLNNGLLDDPRMYQQYADQVVYELCKPYEYLLDYDLAQDALAPDPRFVVIQPHNKEYVVDISIYHHIFLSRAVKLYSQGRVQLSNFLKIV